jgi:hypothetical protein
LTLVVVRLTLAPIFISTDAFAVGVFRLPDAVVRPVTPRVLARAVAPRTSSVPSISTAVAVIDVLTDELPTLTLVVVRLTLAPTLTPTDAFAVGVFRLPEAVVSPVIARVFERVVLPVTASVLANIVLPVTASVFASVVLPVTAIVFEKVELPVTTIVLAKLAFDVTLAAPTIVR